MRARTAECADLRETTPDRRQSARRWLAWWAPPGSSCRQLDRQVEALARRGAIDRRAAELLGALANAGQAKAAALNRARALPIVGHAQRHARPAIEVQMNIHAICIRVPAYVGQRFKGGA